MKQFQPKSIRLDRRHWRLGISSALKWMKKPVSEEGATQVARFMIGLQGPRYLEDVEQMRYPLELEELVDGVEVSEPDSPDVKIVKFLQRLPVDPFTGEAEWGLRSYQDDWDSDNWGRENVYDVYSLSDMRALDDTYYKDW